MTTPEGKVKDNIKLLLKSYKIYPASKAGNFPSDAVGWYYMPSQQGLGVSGIPDFIGCFHRWFFAIEAKAEKKSPTGFQAMQVKAIKSTSAAVFIVDGFESLRVFEDWLIKIIEGE